MKNIVSVEFHILKLKIAKNKFTQPWLYTKIILFLSLEWINIQLWAQNPKIKTKCYEKHQFFQTIFLCYYNSKYFASEPFFIEEMEEKKGGKSGCDIFCDRLNKI